jgi:hypothetical protein
MRLQRLVISWGALATLAVACTHDDPVTTPVSQNGEDTIAIITMSAAPAGFLSGSRAITYLSSGPFDTSVADAFARGTGATPYLYWWGGNCGGYDNTGFVYAPGPAYTDPYSPPARFLPAIVQTASATDLEGCGSPTAYIVPASNSGNGGNVWEFWHDFTGLTNGVRYVQGLARYAVVQRGALDHADILLNGAVAAPDTLVFMAGDFNPAGKKGNGAFTTNCASVNIIHAVSKANPMLLAGGNGGDAAAGGMTIDQTICAIGTGADTVWAKSLTAAKTPIAPNKNTKPNKDQYNFFVLWQALADSTPDYTKPVYRLQIGPLIDVNGNVINNGFAPTPTAQLTGSQLGPLPGATSVIDSLKTTFNLLKPLTAGAYQLWLTKTGTSNTAHVTASRVVRLAGTTVKDTVTSTGDFNLVAGQNAARVEFNFASFTAQSWDRAVLVVQPTTGATTLPSQPSEPLWTKITNPKPSGTLAVLLANMTFGSFDNGAADSSVYGAGGSGTGGFFGTQLVQSLSRLSRPPVGYEYEAWLTNSADTSVHLNAGVLHGPAPEYVSLRDADTMTTSPLSGVEITEATFATDPGTYAAWCKIGTIVGTPPDTSIKAIYDQLQIRLGPKGGNPAILSPTVTLSAAIAVPVGATHNKGKCSP